MTTIIIPTSHPIASAMETAGKEYNLRKQQEKGALTVPPYIFSWSAGVLAAIEIPEVSEADKAILVQHAKTVTRPEPLVEHVHICRASQAFAPGMHKLSFSVGGELQPILDLLVRVLVSTGGCVKFGTPPRSSGERKVAKLLADLGEWNNLPPAQ
ncbi:unnamed protein product [Polarella glacialis]|uniref:Uncharacterized protein n=1 Tax=Polarella glacialis TaxID=89957 RepID=A0A813JQ39_POLGL|nr:unnamed protein product [Polarella glacialis]